MNLFRTLKINGFKIEFSFAKANSIGTVEKNRKAAKHFAIKIKKLKKLAKEYRKIKPFVPYTYLSDIDTSIAELRSEFRGLKTYNKKNLIKIQIQSIHSPEHRKNITLSLNRVKMYSNELDRIKSDILYFVRETRLAINQVRQKHRTYKNIFYYTKGGIFFKENSILDLANTLKFNKIRRSKKPKTFSHHVGVEIECLIDTSEDALCNSLIDVGLESKVSVKDDASIRGSGEAVEITICDTEKEVFSTVDKVCEILQDHGARVNKSCGLHVHLDVRSKNASLIASRLIRAQPFLYSMLPSTRKENYFCYPTQLDADIYDSEDSYRNARYRGVNLQSYKKFSTVEVRMHSASVMSEKINNWIKILLAVSKNNIPKITRSSIKYWIDTLDLDSNLTQYVKDRVKKFNGPNFQIPTQKQFFKNITNVNRGIEQGDDIENENACTHCGYNNNFCECRDCDRCSETCLSEYINFDDVNEEHYCESCYDTVMDARLISENRDQ